MRISGISLQPQANHYNAYAKKHYTPDEEKVKVALTINNTAEKSIAEPTP